MAAYKAFREPSLITDPLDDSDFSDFAARKLRYAVYWSFYEQNAYRDIHAWSKTYKTKYGLYKHIRNIYNPAYRLAEFWKAHLMGGSLNPDAETEGALPIETDTGALRPAIGQVWRWSNWQINKDIFTLHGSIFGDVGLQVVDDVARSKVYLKVIHPGIIKELDRDPQGNVKGYTFEEQRTHPETGRAATYMETAERAGEAVVYRTYADGKLYAWDGISAEWAEPYGFIPLVVVQHNNVGLDWGWSEFHPSREKIHEVDDLASKLHDQIRKMVEAPWLMAGVDEPKSGRPRATGATATTSRPEPAREEIPIFYGPVGATATPLVAPLDIQHTSAEIKEVISELERDYPELKVDILRASGEVSGRALRIAQQPAEDKAGQRRASYDDALVRAQQMAVAIGGWRGYFSGFNLASYAAGQLDHSIGERPVFTEDPLDRIEYDEAFWKAAEQAGKAGIPLEMYLEEQGWDETRLARLAELLAAREARAQQIAAGQTQNPASQQTDAPPAETGEESDDVTE